MQSQPVAERRQVPPEGEVGAYNPGIIRVEQRAIADLDEHDSMWHRSPRPGYQNEYSLLKHSTKLARIAEEVSEDRGRDSETTKLIRGAALTHDHGKLEESCWVYRVNRDLTLEERRVINEHARYSGDFILESMPIVRPADRLYLSRLFYLVRYHHTPYMIGDAELRSLAFDLCLMDTFLSLTEDRHRPGLSQFQAIDKLGDIIVRNGVLPEYRPYQHELVTSFSFIRARYGKKA